VETLLGSGKVDFGVSYEDGLTLARAAGQKLTAIYEILQKPDLVIGVRANRTDINSPKDLDGKTYAGFGIPFEKPFLQTVIKNAGGTGTFKTITLSTSAYDAVWSGHADFDLPEPTWEVIEARLLGKPFKTFNPYSYGAAAPYSELMAASDAIIKSNPDLVKRFVAATAKGYMYAVQHPAAAAKILIDDNSQALKNTQLVDQSQALESSQYYLDANGKLGTSDPARWRAYTEFLQKYGILKDSSGKTITAPFDSSALFTNAFLPASTS
jgi:ABC-type nitrate/sulfonate/bicarbonate transport system substrate-binding protein